LTRFFDFLHNIFAMHPKPYTGRHVHAKFRAHSCQISCKSVERFH